MHYQIHLEYFESIIVIIVIVVIVGMFSLVQPIKIVALGVECTTKVFDQSNWLYFYAYFCSFWAIELYVRTWQLQSLLCDRYYVRIYSTFQFIINLCSDKVVGFVSLLGAELVRFLNPKAWQMKSVWMHWRTSWKRPGSWLKRPTRNMMRWRVHHLHDRWILHN